MISFLALAVAALVTAIFYRRYCQRRTGLCLPPGPKALHCIGNIFDLPAKGIPEFQHWLKHKDVYGPISSISILGYTMIFLHDKQAAHDLLHVDSRKTSHRPTTGFISRFCNAGQLIVLQQYNEKFRRHRRLIDQVLGKKAAVAFNNEHRLEVQKFLLRVLNQPDALMDQLKMEAGAVILKIIYGYSAQTSQVDPLIDLVERTMDKLSRAIVPLSWTVDVVPALKYVPEGFPGASFKKKARQLNKTIQDTVDVPYSFVRRRMATGNYRPSYVSKLVQQCSANSPAFQLSGDDEHGIKWTAAAMYGAAADTSVHTLRSFILAMVLFPAVQRRAQEEIDCVVGDGSLPQFEDREKLPYIDAVVKEALRWSPVIPMGIPHVMAEERIYKNYIIPKGSILLPAVWWFLHDHEVYMEPHCFSPERYLDPRNEPDPKAVAFGYGRRICPGRHIADASIFLHIVQILHVFSISKAMDEQGREIEPQLRVTSGAIGKVIDFPHKIIPRSAVKAELVRRIVAELPKEGGNDDFIWLKENIIS